MDNLRILLHIIYICLIITGLVIFASMIDNKSKEIEAIKLNQKNISMQLESLHTKFDNGITITLNLEEND